MGVQIYYNDRLIFQDPGKWLHPLFSTEEFLDNMELSFEETIPIEDMFLRDTVIGKAAALLIINMGFKKCHGDLMSVPAQKIFEKFGIDHTYDRLIDSIECMTEELLMKMDSPAEARTILKERAEKAKARTGVINE